MLHLGIVKVKAVKWHGVVNSTRQLNDAGVQTQNYAGNSLNKGLVFNIEDCLASMKNIPYKYGRGAGNNRIENAPCQLQSIAYAHYPYDQNEDIPATIVDWLNGTEMMEYVKSVIEVKVRNDLTVGAFDQIAGYGRMQFYMRVMIDPDDLSKLKSGCGCTCERSMIRTEAVYEGMPVIEVCFAGVVIFGKDCLEVYAGRLDNPIIAEKVLTAIDINNQDLRTFINETTIRIKILYERSTGSGLPYKSSAFLNGKLQPVQSTITVANGAEADFPLHNVVIPFYDAVKHAKIKVWCKHAGCTELYDFQFRQIKPDIRGIFNNADPVTAKTFREMLPLNIAHQKIICSNVRNYFKLFIGETGLIGFKILEDYANHMKEISKEAIDEITDLDCVRVCALTLFVKYGMDVLSCFSNESQNTIKRFFNVNDYMMTDGIRAAEELCPSGDSQMKQLWEAEAAGENPMGGLKSLDELMPKSRISQALGLDSGQAALPASVVDRNPCFGSNGDFKPRRTFVNQDSEYSLQGKVTNEIIGKAIQLAVLLSASLSCHVYIENLVHPFCGKVLETRFEIVHRPPAAQAMKDIMVNASENMTAFCRAPYAPNYDDWGNAVMMTMNMVQDIFTKVTQMIFARCVMLHSAQAENLQQHRDYEMFNHLNQTTDDVKPQFVLSRPDGEIVRRVDDIIDWGRMFLISHAFVEQRDGKKVCNAAALEKSMRLFVRSTTDVDMVSLREARYQTRQLYLFHPMIQGTSYKGTMQQVISDPKANTSRGKLYGFFYPRAIMEQNNNDQAATIATLKALLEKKISDPNGKVTPAILKMVEPLYDSRDVFELYKNATSFSNFLYLLCGEIPNVNQIQKGIKKTPVDSTSALISVLYTIHDNSAQAPFDQYRVTDGWGFMDTLDDDIKNEIMLILSMPQFMVHRYIFNKKLDFANYTDIANFPFRNHYSVNTQIVDAFAPVVPYVGGGQNANYGVTTHNSSQIFASTSLYIAINALIAGGVKNISNGNYNDFAKIVAAETGFPKNILIPEDDGSGGTTYANPAISGLGNGGSIATDTYTKLMNLTAVISHILIGGPLNTTQLSALSGPQTKEDGVGVLSGYFSSVSNLFKSVVSRIKDVIWQQELTPDSDAAFKWLSA